MKPSKIVKVFATIMIVSVCLTALVMTGPSDEVDEAFLAYNRSTQDFNKTSVETVIKQLEKETVEPSINNPSNNNTEDVNIPGISNNPIPSDLADIINLSFDEAFSLAVGGIGDFNSLKVFTADTQNKLTQAQATCSTTISVKVWNWANRSATSTDYTKESKDINICCNKLIAPLLKAVMDEIYNHPSKPVMYFGGCYNVRSMRGSNSTSAHAYGCAVDFNASSELNNKGNTFSSGVVSTPSTAEWNALPDCQAKYEIFYTDGVVVQTFYKYGFYWGGSWTRTSDGMHFGFLGDNGTNARQIGQNNARGRGFIE